MLTKEKADKLADEILASERRANETHATLRLKAIPWYLYVRELKGTSAEEQSELAAAAGTITIRSVAFWLGAGTLFVALVLLSRAFNSWPAMLLAAPGIAATRVVLHRRAFKRLLSAHSVGRRPHTIGEA